MCKKVALTMVACGNDGVVGKLRPMGKVGLQFEQHEVEVVEPGMALDGHRSNPSETRCGLS